MWFAVSMILLETVGHGGRGTNRVGMRVQVHGCFAVVGCRFGEADAGEQSSRAKWTVDIVGEFDACAPNPVPLLLIAADKNPVAGHDPCVFPMSYRLRSSIL